MKLEFSTHNNNLFLLPTFIVGYNKKWDGCYSLQIWWLIWGIDIQL